MAIHLAGQPEDLKQFCVLCRTLLVDYTGTMMLSSDIGPRFYEPLSSIETGPTFTTVTTEPPNCIPHKEVVPRES